MADETDQEAEAKRLEEEARIAHLRDLQNAPPRAEDIALQPLSSGGYPQYEIAAFQRGMADQARIASQQSQPTDAVQNAVNRLAQEPAPQVSDYTQRGLLQQAGGVMQGSPLSQQEEAFWQANPNGAVKDPQTGALIGLGSGQAPQGVMDEYARFGSGQGAPAVKQSPQSPFQYQPQQAPTAQDFINPQIEARRNQIANERSVIMRNLNTFSKVRPGRGQMSPWEAEYSKLKAIDHADGVLQREQATQANLKATIAHRNFQTQRVMDTDNQTAQFFAGLNQVKSPIGTPEHAQEVVALSQQFPLAMSKDEVRKTLKEHADLHDNTAQLIANAQAQGKTVTQTGISASGKPTYKITPSQGEVVNQQIQKETAKAFAKAPFTPEQFAQRSEIVGTDKEGKQVEGPEQTHMRVTIGEHQYLVPVDQFNKMNNAMPTANPNPAAAQPSATPAQAPQGTRVVGGVTYRWTGKRWEPQ